MLMEKLRRVVAVNSGAKVPKQNNNNKQGGYNFLRGNFRLTKLYELS